MSTTTLTPIQTVFAKVHSPTGLIFPETVASLLKLGVTRYHVDYISRTITTYAPNPSSTTTSPSTLQTTIETEQVTIPAPAVKPDTAWDQAGLARAIKRVQQGETIYSEFARECVDAGVTGYFAFLTGKRVLYYGLNGDVHVEWFPGAGPKGQE